MAFVAGVTKTVGDTLTAANWNDYYGDSSSIDFLKTELDKINDISVDATPARAVDVVYQNTSGGIMIITVSVTTATGGSGGLKIGSADPPTTDWGLFENSSGGTATLNVLAVIPDNWYYEENKVGGVGHTLTNWVEWSMH